MDKLDFTQPLALACEPYVAFSGPFTEPDPIGRRCAVVNGLLASWASDGKCFGQRGEQHNLIPLQEKPEPWKVAVVDYNPEMDDPWGYAYPVDIKGASYINKDYVDMIEMAAAEFLADAITTTITVLKTQGQELPMLEKTLNAYRSRL